MAFTLITGASTGLGADFASLLAERKHDLILVARDERRLRDLATKLTADHNIKCHVIAQDLAQPTSAESLLATVKSMNLEVDILVNNAGFGTAGEFARDDYANISRMMQLNINTLTQLTRLFLPAMLARKTGRILNIASTAAFQPGPWMAVYYATKAFVLSFGEALSVELKGTGVTLTTFCPGPTATEFAARANMKEPLMKKLIFADSLSCAQKGVRGMFRGDVVVIDGFVNAIMARSIGFLPRAWVRTILAIINGAVKK